MNTVGYAFMLTIIAGLSTGIGSCIAFFAKQTNKKILSISLGFSAGVMIYVSMIEIFSKAQESLVQTLGTTIGSWVTVLSFFGGMLVIASIDILIPSGMNPHEIKQLDTTKKVDVNLYRMGFFTAVAIAIHNIPEGIAVSVPIYYATGSKKKAFLYSFLSGISEPLGALIG